MSGEQNDMENRPMNLHFSLACFFAPIWAWLAFQCSVWSFILTHSPMPVYYIRKIMLCPVALSKQTQLFHLMAVLCAGGHDVDARRIDAAVTENICQFCNILLHTIESPGKEFPQIVGNTLSRFTFACAHSRFMADQIWLRFIGLPVRVRKICPLWIPAPQAYCNNSFCSPLGIRMLRVLFLHATEISPARTASTVKYCSSDTRIPVAQSVCSSSHSR